MHDALRRDFAVNGVINMTDDWDWIPYAGASNSDDCCCGVFAAQLVVWRMSAVRRESTSRHDLS